MEERILVVASQMALSKLGEPSRIRRRRAQDVADTTDSLRAVACIRFVRRHSEVHVLCLVRVLSSRSRPKGQYITEKMIAMNPGISTVQRIPFATSADAWRSKNAWCARNIPTMKQAAPRTKTIHAGRELALQNCITPRSRSSRPKKAQAKRTSPLTPAANGMIRIDNGPGVAGSHDRLYRSRKNPSQNASWYRGQLRILERSDGSAIFSALRLVSSRSISAEQRGQIPGRALQSSCHAISHVIQP